MARFHSGPGTLRKNRSLTEVPATSVIGGPEIHLPMIRSPIKSAVSTGQPKRFRALIFASVVTAAWFCFQIFKPFQWISAEVLETLGHALGTLSVIGLVHLVDQFWMGRDLEAHFEDIRAGFEEVRSELMDSSASLQAMNDSGMLRIYPNRLAAALDMSRDLRDHVREVRIMGISLNDFVGEGAAAPLHELLVTVRSILKQANGAAPKSDGPAIKKTTIRMLIIDPDCFGARLREKAESRDTTHQGPSKLRDDLKYTTGQVEDLLKLAKAAGGSAGIDFECRYYRLAPTLFMCWTDQVCYVQPYHFGVSRERNASTPVFKCGAVRESSERRHLMHGDMLDHFDWIWEHASVGLDEQKIEHLCGTDRGIKQTGALNCFTDSELARERIICLLKSRPKRLVIQGITLHSFFQPEPPDLREALFDLFENPDATPGTVIRLLVLDPECEQARLRSYREHLLREQVKQESLSFEAYCDRPSLHAQSDLFVHTTATIRAFELWKESRIGSPKGPDVELRSYKSAPGCFLLHADATILVEQYCFGKIRQHTRNQGEKRHPESERKGLLGRDMPLFEYKDVDQIFYQKLGRRNPFNLLSDHLDFVLKQSLPVSSSKNEPAA